MVRRIPPKFNYGGMLKRSGLVMSGERYIVYWARLAEHDDPYSEGYVGISQNSLYERKRSHYKTAKSNVRRNNHFHNALIKYGDGVVWGLLHDDLTK